jgi:hypothetical protein
LTNSREENTKIVQWQRRKDIPIRLPEQCLELAIVFKEARKNFPFIFLLKWQPKFFIAVGAILI